MKNHSLNDDGIEFQWGDRYIQAEEVIEGIGGKYWRQNEDGSITQFDPPELRYAKICSSIINDFRKPTYEFDELENYRIDFRDETAVLY